MPLQFCIISCIDTALNNLGVCPVSNKFGLL